MHIRSTRRARPALALALTLLSLAAHAQDPPAPPPPPPDRDGPPPPAPRIADPRLRQRAPSIKTPMRVSYPQAEACMGISGTTVLIVTAGERGEVQDVQVERSSRNRNLDRAAMNAAREMRFSPEIFNGQAVQSRSRIPVDFMLPDTPSQSCLLASVELLDSEGAAQLTPPQPDRPVRARVGLYAPRALQAQLQWLRLPLQPPPRGQTETGEPVHQETRLVERPERAERSTFDASTPQPLPPGRYALEVRVAGELRGRHEFEVR